MHFLLSNCSYPVVYLALCVCLFVFYQTGFRLRAHLIIVEWSGLSEAGLFLKWLNLWTIIFYSPFFNPCIWLSRSLHTVWSRSYLFHICIHHRAHITLWGCSRKGLRAEEAELHWTRSISNISANTSDPCCYFWSTYFSSGQLIVVHNKNHNFSNCIWLKMYKICIYVSHSVVTFF